MPDDAVSAADLAALLERLRLRPQDVPSRAVASQAQLDVAFARIRGLTDLLRSPAVSDETTRLAARLLLADLGLVSSLFRGEANEAAAALEGALRGVTPGD